MCVCVGGGGGYGVSFDHRQTDKQSLQSYCGISPIIVCF